MTLRAEKDDRISTFDKGDLFVSMLVMFYRVLSYPSFQKDMLGFV